MASSHSAARFGTSFDRLASAIEGVSIVLLPPRRSNLCVLLSITGLSCETNMRGINVEAPRASRRLRSNTRRARAQPLPVHDRHRGYLNHGQDATLRSCSQHLSSSWPDASLVVQTWANQGGRACLVCGHACLPVACRPVTTGRATPASCLLPPVRGRCGCCCTALATSAFPFLHLHPLSPPNIQPSLARRRKFCRPVTLPARELGQ